MLKSLDTFPIGTKFKYIGVELPFAGTGWVGKLMYMYNSNGMDYIQLETDNTYNTACFPSSELECISNKFEIVALRIKANG